MAPGAGPRRVFGGPLTWAANGDRLSAVEIVLAAGTELPHLEDRGCRFFAKGCVLWRSGPVVVAVPT